MVQRFKDYLDAHEPKLRQEWLDQGTENVVQLASEVHDVIDRCRDARVDGYLMREAIDALSLVEHAIKRYSDSDIQELEVLKLLIGTHAFKLDARLMLGLNNQREELWELAGRPVDNWAAKAAQQAAESLVSDQARARVDEAIKVRHDGGDEERRYLRLGIDVIKDIKTAVSHPVSEATLTELKELYLILGTQIFDMSEEQTLGAWNSNLPKWKTNGPEET